MGWRRQKHRNAYAKSLEDRAFRPRVVREKDTKKPAYGTQDWYKELDEDDYGTGDDGE